MFVSTTVESARCTAAASGASSWPALTMTWLMLSIVSGLKVHLVREEVVLDASNAL